MKKFYLLLLLVLTVIISNKAKAQAPYFEWLKSGGENLHDGGNSLATDLNGNVFAAGYFTTNLNYGSGTLSTSGTSAFIIKYDGDGNVIWAKNPVSTVFSQANGVCVDMNGDIIVTGKFSSPTITFGSIVLTNIGGNDIFIVKYDTNGNVIWAKSGGGTDSDSSNDISSDTSGNVYITGEFRSTNITFGANTVYNTSSGTNEFFIAKYNTNGNVLWVKAAGNGGDEESTSITVDQNGNSIVSGSFTSSSMTFGSSTLSNQGGSDIFMCKYDALGNSVWAKSIYGTDWETGEDVKADVNGNIYITGYFWSTTLTLGGLTITSHGANDGFFAKYNQAGNLIWAKAIGGSDYDHGNCMTFDPNGNVLLAGYFFSDTLTLDTVSLINSGTWWSDIYISKYDPAGNLMYATSGGTSKTDHPKAIASDLNGNMYLTGIAAGSSALSFENLSVNLSDSDYSDYFIVKFTDDLSILKLDEETKTSGLTIYPNPFDTYTIINAGKDVTHGTIKILNADGSEVKQINFSGSEVIVQKNELKAGIYFLQVMDNFNSIQTKKIIIR